MPLWDALAGLSLQVDSYRLERRELETAGGWTRVTTTVELAGAGETGAGEDVTYDGAAHEHVPADLRLSGAWSLGGFSQALDELVLWPPAEPDESLQDYRRWAFESAALDLALRQARLAFGEALGREEHPVRFAVSTRAAIEPWLEIAPAMEFKLDAEAEWDRALMQRLHALDRVRVVDLKAYYRGTRVDRVPDPELYRALAESLPEVVIEDPWLGDGCRQALAGAEDRLSFDAPVHSLADLDALPLAPRWLNVKPSRFGTIRELLATIEACEARRIRMYGGGQYELGPGRGQIQRLAGVFYPDGPNDVAPSIYNEGGPRPGLPQSPLPAAAGVGF